MPSDRVTFDPNTPVRLTFAYDGGKEFPSQFDNSIQTMYSFTDGRVLFAPEDLAVKINYCEPKRGDTLWITKRTVWIKGRNKNKRQTSWEVSTSEPGVIRRDGYQDTRANAQAMQIEESDLERQLRESREVKQRAQTRTQARDNLARKLEPEPEPPAWTEEAPHPADLVKRPPQMAVAAAPAPAARPAQAAVTQLEAALHTVLAACKSATAYARQIEYQAPPFTSDDIARMAMTLVIGKEQRR